MKQIAMLIVAAMTGLLLVACGENAEKKPETTTDVIVVQPEATPAAEVAPEATPDATVAPAAE